MKLDWMRGFASSVGRLTCLSKWERDSRRTECDSAAAGTLRTWILTSRKVPWWHPLLLLLRRNEKGDEEWRKSLSCFNNEKLEQDYVTLLQQCTDLRSQKCYTVIAVTRSWEQWLTLCPLEICQGATLILSLWSVNIIFRSWVSLALKTTCYLYALFRLPSCLP